MNLTLSPQMKIVALVGAIAALALGAGSMILGRGQSAPIAVPPVAHRAHAPAGARAKQHAAAVHATKPKPVAKLKTQPLSAVAADGLPAALDELLHGHRIVVVSLYDPEAPADAIAFAEARAGAKDANAGFLGVDVLDERVAGPLTALAGNGTVLPDPGILFYKRPGTLMNRIDGFADRDAVAAAVASALVADAPAVAPAPVVTTPAPAPIVAAPPTSP